MIRRGLSICKEDVPDLYREGSTGLRWARRPARVKLLQAAVLEVDLGDAFFDCQDPAEVAPRFRRH